MVPRPHKIVLVSSNELVSHRSPTADNMGKDFIKNVLQNLHENFRNDPETADACFVFGMGDETSEKKSLLAHKLILAGGSAVFRSMFYGGLKEAENVPITDFSYDGFSEFIKLFYLSDATVNKDHILEVMAAVDKYDVRGCEPFLLDAIDANNACDVLELATKINLSPAITAKATVVIRENAKDIFKSNGFLTCDEKILKRILEMDTLICNNELAVFKAAMDWAEVRCRANGNPLTDTNKRTVLGECFQLIRFATMGAAEFMETIELYPDVFNYEEFKEILQYILREKPLKLFVEFNYSINRIFKHVAHLPIFPTSDDSDDDDDDSENTW